MITKELIKNKNQLNKRNFCHCRTEQPLEEPTNKEMTVRDMHKILHIEGGEEGSPVDCCPTIKEMSEPVGGQNQQNMYVELYRDGQNRQRFFELSCRPDVLDKPCRFIDRKFRNQSRCVQKYAYSYAIVENHENLKVRSRIIEKFSIIILSLRKFFII